MSRQSAISIIERGDLSKLQHVLEESEWDIGSELLDSKGQTALHIACANGHLDIVQYLVNKKGCSVTVEDVYGHTPLILSLINKHWKMANFLLYIAPNSAMNELEGVLASYNKSIVMEIAKEALVASCKEGYFELVKYIIESGWHTVGYKATQLARHCGNLHIVKFLLTYCQTSCTMPDDMSEVHIACIQGDVEKVKIALDSNGSSLLGTVDHYGTTPIHYATLEPNLLRMIVQYGEGMLLNVTDSMGNTPLHHSIKYECIESAIILVGAPGCDVNIANLKGETPLIAACKYSIVNYEGIAPCDVVGDDGNTLLHNTCVKGNTTIVELLVKNGANVLKTDRHGNAPIHIACKYSDMETLKILVSHSCDPNQQNADGDTALHIVCRAKLNDQDKQQYIQELISTPGIKPEIINHAGFTPVELRETSYSVIKMINSLLEHKKTSIQAYLKIFVVGNSGNGKSTLIKAVTTEASQFVKYFPLSKIKYVDPSDVPPHTAGIVPIPFNSKHFGNAVLYDFAGQHEYYSSHAAVMENLILPSPPLFLLLVDISKSKEVIREELVYWWHFINNQSQKAAAPPHVILAGSHKDMVKSRDRKELEIMISDWIKGIRVSFEYVGYFQLDCRKLVSQGLNALLTRLNTTCQVVRQFVDVNLHCHILNALLRAPEFQDLVYCRTSDIMSRIQSDNALLPKTFSQLIPLLASLNDRGHILLLQNHTDESKSWVILKPDVLLTKVNGSVFAPEYFKEHCEFAMSTGVQPLRNITSSHH